MKRKYKVYENYPEQQRLLHYPSGLSFLQDKLREASTPGGLTAKFQLQEGDIYLCVPFDCPENFTTDALNSGHFYYCNDLNNTDPRDYEEVSTVEIANLGFREQVSAGNCWLIKEYGKLQCEMDLNVFPPKPAICIDEIWYRYADRSCSDDKIYSVPNDGYSHITYLVKAPPFELSNWRERIDYFTENVECIAVSIFDWMGFMLWYPKKSDWSYGWLD